MKTRDFQKRVFEVCIELLDNNIITTIPYLFFIILDTIIKGLYGTIYIFQYLSNDGISFLQDQGMISGLIFFVGGYLILILIFLLIVILTNKSDSTDFFRGFIRKSLISALKANNTFLMVPILTVIFQTFRLGLQSQFNDIIQIYHLAVAILTLLIQFSLFLFTENFVFCFFPNKQIPWSKPVTSIDLLKYVNSVVLSIMLIFDNESRTAKIILFIFISSIQLFSITLSMLQIPYYNTIVDTAVMSHNLTLTYIYVFAVLKAILQQDEGKISFDIVFSVTLVLLILCFYKIRMEQIQKTFIKPNKTSKDFKVQLIELIRISHRNKLDLVIQLQSWIIQHKQYCGLPNCQCLKFKLNEIKNIHSRVYRQVMVNQDHDDNNDENHNIEEQRYDQVIYQDVNMLSVIQQEFYMSQFLEDMEMQLNENPRDYEKRQLLKLQGTVISLINSEIEETGRLDTQLQFLKICVDIFLKNQSYRAYFKILQLQQSLIKLSMKQEFILAYIKKYLINKMNQKEKFKKNSEKIYILNQLKFEISFQRFIIDIQKVTETVDSLWKQSANKSYKILTMIQLMNKISNDYIKIWSKYQDIEGKYLNPELLIVLARFCDQVMGFELEAETLQQKAQSLLNSIKLQQQKGQMIEENLENKIKSQEMLFNVQCSPKCLDKIAFANLKFLQFSGYKLDDIPIVKTIQPQIIAQNHDEKILNYLQRPEKTSSKIYLDTWMKVRAGYIVPIEIKSIPYIDMKHDLRFISLITSKKDFELDDQKYQYNQAFIFLVDSFGKIDSASEECQQVLQIGQKMIENGITLQQVFIGFDFDRVTDYQNGLEFQLDKQHLQEISNQLDINQSDSQLGMFASYRKVSGILQLDQIRMTLNDNSLQQIYLKVYIKPCNYGNIEQSYYEVIALPVQNDTNMQSVKLAPTMHSVHLRGIDGIMESGIKNHSSGQDDSVLANEFGSQSSMTSSQSSKSDKQFQLIRDIKEITQLKGMPPLIVKLRRALNVFFFVMLVTAIVLLVVNIVDKVSFKQDIQAVEEAFRIQYYISNVRLRFQYLYIQSNSPDKFTDDKIFHYKMIQHQLGIYVEDFRLTINNLGFAVQLLSSQLKGLFFDNTINMGQVSKAGSLFNSTTSFQSGCQEVIGKADQYQYSNYTQLKINRSIFGIKYGTEATGSYRLSYDEINSYFINENLADELRIHANRIEADFSHEVIRFGNQSQQNILIFTLVCVVVVVLAGILLLPMLFTIDNTLCESIRTWTQIRFDQKDEQIMRITMFKDFLDQTDFLNEKNSQNKKLREALKEKQKLESINDLQGKGKNAKQQDKTNKKSQIIQNSTKQQNKYIKNIRFNEELVENDNEEELKEEYSPKHIDNKTTNKYNGKKGFTHASQTKRHNTKQQKPKFEQNSKSKQQEIEEDSDSDEDEQIQNGKNQLAEQNQIYQESDGERIHRLSQIITLNKYTFSRKFKMGTVITVFTLGLCAMYVGSYLLASTIYEQTLNDFDILTTISSRSPCAARNIFFLMNQYVKNQTAKDGSQLEDEQMTNIISNCNEIEYEIRQMKRDKQLEYESIKNNIERVDSKEFCNFYNEHISQIYSRNQSERQYLMNQCLTIKNGLLNLGATTAINSIFHNIEQSNIQYLSSNRTQVKTLQSLLYDKDLEINLLIYLNFVGPVLDKIQRMTNATLYEVLEKAFNNVIVMFTIFLAFLLITWYFSIRILIKSLSQTLSRSRISVKMIPAMILIEIKEQINSGVLVSNKVDKNHHKHGHLQRHHKDHKNNSLPNQQQIKTFE